MLVAIRMDTALTVITTAIAQAGQLKSTQIVAINRANRIETMSTLATALAMCPVLLMRMD